jgi:putative heme-binding domain-containing protein
MKQCVLRSVLVLAVGLAWWQFTLSPGGRTSIPRAQAATVDPPAAAPRTPLTTSKVSGAPEPPPPYRTQQVFPKLHFKNPLEMVVAPDSDRWFVVEQAGRIFSFPNRQDCDRADLFLDIRKQVSLPANGVLGDTYGLAFHPQFAKNRYCYICYVVMGKPGNVQLPDGARVSRFRVTDTDPPRCDPASEKVMITWLGGGHDGGSLKFGPDGYLYISTGDTGNPNPPDPRDTGQDISDLPSSILRIDVDLPSRDKAGGEKPYTIPADNPFVKMPGARGEVWAYGLRNPWRMSFDRQTGDLWVGDVGWELWEMIYRIQKGGNYGWSIMEGPQPVHPAGKRGPTPIIPPNFQYRHPEACSITGGYVYRGKRLKELFGTYICGDWETRRVWGTRFDGDKPVAHRELANSGPRIVAFGESREGELYILDYDLGGIYELQPNPDSGSNARFPTKLSDTGLFASVQANQPAPGVVPFSIMAEQWADYATAEHFVALPRLSSVEVHDNPPEIAGTMFRQEFVFPKDGLLLKTFSMEMERGNPASRKRLETQMLHYNGHTWHGYSYRWNDDQTDATLVGPGGQDRTLTVTDAQAPGGKREQTWHYAGRNECSLCHNPWAGHRLAFTLPQLAGHHQIERLEKMAILKRIVDPPEEFPDLDKKPPATLVDPYDKSADVNSRARSYLQVNCAHCHQFGAGGTAVIELRADFAIQDTKALDAQPTQGTFGIQDAKILAPGDPYRSILFYRVSKMGHGRMPHIESELVDQPGVELLHDWIRQLPIHKEETAAVEHLRSLDEATVLARERRDYRRDLTWRARDLARQDERQDATDADRKRAAEQLQHEARERVAQRVKDRVETIERLLSSPTNALLLLHEMDSRPLPPALHEQVVSAAYAHGDVQIRDLFERFVPPEKRVKRLGNLIDTAQLLSVPGDAQRGRLLFFGNSAAQCKNCHRIGEQGGQVGPELTQIGKKYDRSALLAKIADPSKKIDPKYAAYIVQTSAGKSYLGILVDKTSSEVVLRDAQNNPIRIPLGDVEQLLKQSRSLMPDQLLRDMTAQQAADLLAYLYSLK